MMYLLPANFIVTKFTLELKEVKREDAGVYMCVVYSDCRTRGIEFVIFTVIALTLRHRTPHHVRETRPLKLTCNSVALQFVLSNLSASWYVDDFLFKNYTDTFMTEVKLFVYLPLEIRILVRICPSLY